MALKPENSTRTDVAESTGVKQLVIGMGAVTLGLQCADERIINRWLSDYADFITEDEPDLTVRVETVSRLRPQEVQSAVSEMRFTHSGESFTEANGLIQGDHDLDRRTITIRGDIALLNPDLDFNAMNRLMSVAYYSACKVKFGGLPPAYLVHTCAIARNGSALLFAGPCEAGKTTIAGQCGQEHGRVVNDEAVLVTRPEKDGGGILARAAPIVGGYPATGNGSYPVSCVIILKKGLSTLLRPLDRTAAYLRFMRQVINPAYIGQRGGRAVYSQIADFSDEVTSSVPFFELEFTLDKEPLWSKVAELETSLSKRG